MKISKDILKSLNKNLSSELTAINQYIIHAAMLQEWGYCLLHDKFKKYAIDEMHHLDGLIDLILGNDGEVELELGKIKLGKNVKEMVNLQIEAEEKAIEEYNETIKMLHDEGKNNHINHDVKQFEEKEVFHLEELEKQQAQIDQMGLEVYLSTLTDEE